MDTSNKPHRIAKAGTKAEKKKVKVNKNAEKNNPKVIQLGHVNHQALKNGIGIYLSIGETGRKVWQTEYGPGAKEASFSCYR